MKKTLVIVLSAIVMLSLVPVQTAHAVQPLPPLWTGYPDPIACNQYLDCRWTTPVCIGDITYHVGIHMEYATPEQVEAYAKQYSGMILKAGYCPWKGYSIPWLILYTSSALENGFGILVSSQQFVAMETALAFFNLSGAAPSDFAQVCAGPVAQKNPEDLIGQWSCDSMLYGIMTGGGSGTRLPLITEDDSPSLQKIYQQLQSWSG